MHRWPVKMGDRVALAPHLDLWMAGVRFGDVVTAEGDRYLIHFGGERTAWLDRDDLLGAVR